MYVMDEYGGPRHKHTYIPSALYTTYMKRQQDIFIKCTTFFFFHSHIHKHVHIVSAWYVLDKIIAVDYFLYKKMKWKRNILAE